MQKIKIETVKLVGISVRTTNENGKSSTDIPELWNRFMSENILPKIPNKVDHNIYSVYTDYEGDHTKPYTTFIGYRVTNIDDLSDNLTSLLIEEGNYIKFTAHGDMSKGLIVNEWMKIWELDIDRTFVTDFEVYGEKSQNPMNAEVDIFVGVK